MTQPKIFRLSLLTFLLFFVSACTNVFETTTDIQAQKALQDLIEAQKKYHQENNKYASSLISLQKYDLKYHTGLVYMEIESADANKYRAIALPAESTTARVFAYDADMGGLYEMQDEEVKKYVLGALKHVRDQQTTTKVKDYISFAIIGFLLVMGVKSLFENLGNKVGTVFIIYFLSLLPMTWSLVALNHMDKNVMFSRLIIELNIAALVCALISTVFGSGSLIKLPASEKDASSLFGLLVSSIAGSVLSCGVVAYLFFHFYRG